MYCHLLCYNNTVCCLFDQWSKVPGSNIINCLSFACSIIRTTCFMLLYNLIVLESLFHFCLFRNKIYCSPLLFISLFSFMLLFYFTLVLMASILFILLQKVFFLRYFLSLGKYFLSIQSIIDLHYVWSFHEFIYT